MHVKPLMAVAPTGSRSKWESGKEENTATTSRREIQMSREKGELTIDETGKAALTEIMKGGSVTQMRLGAMQPMSDGITKIRKAEEKTLRGGEMLVSIERTGDGDEVGRARN